jgi:hypothetical protein|tara:strand:+ start:24 stop:413 length:390 start_codon:yes stop_codon:yes gene_type:complete
MNKKEKLPSNRNFGVVFFVVFLIIGLWPLLEKSEIRYWSVFISSIFLLLGLINSNLLSPLNKIWFNFGKLLSKIITPLIMGVIFFLVVTPIGLIMRVLGKDILSLKYNENSKSYWIEKDGIKSKMKNQF